MSHRSILVALIATLIPCALAHAGGPGYAPRPGWPQLFVGNSVDGGMLVNMDADPELELVQITGTTVRALNLDGTSVPGWPRTIDYGTFSAPAFGDINGDGLPEVVVHSFFYGIEGSVWAWRQNGALLPGFPRDIGGTLKSPTLADVDGDGDLDILSTANDGVGRLYAIDDDGSDLPGWPRNFDDVIGTSASAGDVNGDGTIEIFACSFTRLYGYRTDGTILPGFPFTPGDQLGFNYTSPVLADLDGDGDREIIASSSAQDDGSGRVHVLHHDGSGMSGWPRQTNEWIYGPASVADIDGDGWLDVAVGDLVLSPEPINSVYAWDRNGVALPGFPVGLLNAIHTQIIIADVDGDNAMELLFDDNTGGGDVQALNHDGTPLQGWPLPVEGSSFLQCVNIADVDGDGFLDIASSGLDIQGGNTSLTLWDSAANDVGGVPWSPERAPVPTYQYNVRRDGMVPGPASCDADISGDGTVDAADLAALLDAWGFNPGHPADLDGDFSVGPADLAALLDAWGGC